ncbi:MAG: class I SAM-dependent methyltransferase [Acidobacteria bacterium]|nr:class I SAM-dependent methyltransferase [Acidobacteriota bacterium]
MASSSERTSPERHGFDQYASGYDSYLNQALAATGEDSAFFARGRVRWLADCLVRLGMQPATALDFGCGIGSTAPLLLAELRCASVIGVDSSPEIIKQAQRTYSTDQIQFQMLSEFRPPGNLDCAYSNGVFHHIPIEERAAALRSIRAALRPGGVFALWENNPWNPGTQYVMSRCSFDEDAITISPVEAGHMLRDAGFEILRTDYLFFFPKSLSALRPLEALLRKIPLGGQYQVLCRKTRDAE